MINDLFWPFLQHLYPKSQIDIYITILEDDGCILAAALTVAGLALVDASIQVFDTLVGASLVRLYGLFFTFQHLLDSIFFSKFSISQLFM